MTGTSKSDFIVEKADLVKERDEILQLWQEGFPEEKSMEQKLDWFYVNNPSKKSSIFLLKKDGEAIGVKGIGGKNWLLNKNIIKAGLFSDLTVKKEYRTVGPALQLISDTVNLVNSELPLLYGFPNEKSVVVYRRGGFKLLGKINRYAKPLQYSFYIAKYSKKIPITLARLVDKILSLYEWFRNMRLNAAYSCAISQEFGAEFDTLWKLAESNGFCMAQRNREFLTWRFNNTPSFHVFTVKSIAENNLCGYVVYSLKSDTVVRVHDFFAADDRNHLLVLLRLFSQQMKKLNYTSITMEFFGAEQYVDVIRKVGFKMRDSQPIVCRLNSDMGEMASLNWYITSADRDT